MLNTKRQWLCIFLLVFILTNASAQDMDTSMVFVKGGSFTMGCTFEQGSACSADEKPSHLVNLKSFAIAKTEVTQKLWKSVMGSNPSRFQGDSLPVDNVSWDEIQIFIQRINQMTGKSYRLPTEAEWEYAARGGAMSKQLQYSGSAELNAISWYANNSENTTHKVASLQANELGLYDMSGNVWEWCSDTYGPYSSNTENNPTGAKKGASKILRGGCFASIPQQCRVACRKSYYSGGKDYTMGFRLAMDDDREAKAAEARIAAEAAAAEQAKLAEQARVAAEKATADSLKQAEKATADSLKQVEQARIAAEKATADSLKRVEQARIAAEKTTADSLKQVEMEKIAAEKRAEQEKVAAAKLEQHNQKVSERKARYDAIPNSTFFTLNATYTSMPDWAVGFKIGTAKVVGWYVNVMTNFNYKGMFSSFDENGYYELTGKAKSSYLGGHVGVVYRPHNVVSIHFGVGYAYRTLNYETFNKGWHNYPQRTFSGPAAALGLMFHIGGFVISAEATSMVYNLNTVNPVKYSLGGQLGLGFCLPNKKKNNINE